MTTVADAQAVVVALQDWRQQWLQQQHDPAQPLVCYIGLSGGLDSTVLLHAVQQLAVPAPLEPRQRALTVEVVALHLDHGIHPAAARWRNHCQRLCQALDVPLRVKALAPGSLAAAGGSLEAAARTARYAFFAEQLQQPGAALLLAHHADDQTETLLLRLLQGRGLLPMPATRPLGAGTLWRPLLSLPRAVLRTWAEQHHLAWLEDPGNEDEALDRNYLRHRIVPPVLARWPRTADHLLRVAQRSVDRDAALATALADQARLPIAWCQAAGGVSLLRSWLGRFSEFAVTDRALSEFILQLSSSPDRAPVLRLTNGQLQRQDAAVVYQPAD